MKLSLVCFSLSLLSETMEKKLVEETKQLELDLNDERLRYQNLLNEFSRLEERYDDLKEEMTLMVVSQILLPISIKNFPGGSEDKASACNAEDLGSIPGLGRSPGEGKWQPAPVFLPGESHGQKSLAGYSPRGCRVRDDLGTKQQRTGCA